jgi:hypothetical protein
LPARRRATRLPAAPPPPGGRRSTPAAGHALDVRRPTLRRLLDPSAAILGPAGAARRSRTGRALMADAG